MRRLLPVLFVAAIALVGCQKNAQHVREQRKTYPSKVVSLSPGATEIVLTYSALPNLSGRTQADNWPTRATSAPVVASVKPDYEKIAEINPSHIFYDAALFSDQDIEKLKSSTKATLYRIDANTMDGFIEQLYEIGTLLMAETTVNDYVSKILQAEAAAQGDLQNPLPKVAVIMPGQGGNDYILGKNSFLADAVRSAGGEPVGPDSTIFVPLNAEVIAGLDPDVIIVPGTKTDIAGAKSVANNAKYKTLKAIRDGRLKVIDRDVLLRRGGRVDKLIEGLHKAFRAGGAN